MHTDDPRLTAYALGELDPPDQAEIEALLQSDLAAAQEVAEIRELAQLVRTQLATEDAPPLAPEQQQEILSEAAAPRRAASADPRTTTAWRRLWMPAAIAACTALLAGYGALYYGRTHTLVQAGGASQMGDLPPPAVPAGALVTDLDADGKPTFPAPAELAPAPATDSVSLGTTVSGGSEEQKNRQDIAVSGTGILTLSIPAAPTSAPAAPVQPGRKWMDGRAKLQDGSSLEFDKAKRERSSATLSGTTAHEGSRPGGFSKDAAATPANQRADLKEAPRLEGRAHNLPQPSATAAPFAPGEPGALPAPPAAPAPRRASPVTVSGIASEGPTGSGATDAQARKPASLFLGSISRTKGRAVAGASQDAAEKNPGAVAQLQVPGTPMTRKPGEVESRSGNATGQAGSPDRPTNGESARDNPAEPAKGLKQNEEETKAALGFIHSGVNSLLLQAEPPNTDSYDVVTDNAFLEARSNPLSTFSIDVDTASYSNVRRLLMAGERPPKGAVRIEELINYFVYAYPQPKAGEPFSVNMEVAACPWTPAHRLLRIGLKARDLDSETRPQANLVFLLDVSGSMMPENRLPLVKQCLRLLVEKLGPQDTVAIAVYAGASGTVLEPTNDKEKILAALDQLQAGGSTNGASGIKLAYDLAKKRFQKDRTNRVILATDGDFNVGITNQSDLTDLIKAKAKSGVYLTVLGFGYGNLKDSTLEKLADQGNGNYGYIDTLAEGRKMLVEQMSGTLFTVAKDVKMQIEFNPVQVEAYRLIGYENRLLAKEDFNDDTKDAGEIGAGHTVTALYEVVPVGLPVPGAAEVTKVDELKYQPVRGLVSNGAAAASPAAAVDRAKYAPDAAAKASPEPAVEARVPAEEMLTLKLRWKAPDGDVSTKREFPLTDAGVSWEKSSTDFRWAASVASFGMLLRDSPHKGQATWATTRELAIEGQGKNADSHRIEFLELIGKAEAVVK